MNWLFLSIRNVVRQRHRSGIALAAVAFGVVSLLIAGGFIEWLFWAMREDTVRSRLGHVQLSRPGFHEQGAANPMAFLIPSDVQSFARVENAPGVVTVTPRLMIGGLISRGAVTAPFIGEGVDPVREARMKRLDQFSAGEDLAASDPNGITLGKGLAASLGAQVGDTVVLLASTKGGGVNAVEGRVRGIFATSSKALDDAAMRAPIGLAQKLLRVTGSHVWVVLLDRTEDTERSVADLVRILGQRGLQVVPWTQLADLYNKTVALFTRQVNAMKLIIAAIIVLGISNTMMMSIIERTGEIGTAMAIGTTRRNVMFQFLGEGLLIGFFGGLVGLAVGGFLAMVISHVGIPMPPAPGMTLGYTAGIRLTPGLVIDAMVLATTTALAASAYPAWRASRQVIVDALRHNH